MQIIINELVEKIDRERERVKETKRETKRIRSHLICVFVCAKAPLSTDDRTQTHRGRQCLLRVRLAEDMPATGNRSLRYFHELITIAHSIQSTCTARIQSKQSYSFHILFRLCFLLFLYCFFFYSIRRFNSYYYFVVCSRRTFSCVYSALFVTHYALIYIQNEGLVTSASIAEHALIVYGTLDKRREVKGKNHNENFHNVNTTNVLIYFLPIEQSTWRVCQSLFHCTVSVRCLDKHQGCMADMQMHWRGPYTMHIG